MRDAPIPEYVEEKLAAGPVFEGPGAAPNPEYLPRDPGEWQGRLVEENVHEVCNDLGFCGRAKACRSDNTCGPCLSDHDCGSGEVCVLDQCLLRDNVRCRKSADCGGHKYCVIDQDVGLNGPRGNEKLFAFCEGSQEEHEMRDRRGIAREMIQKVGVLPHPGPSADPIDKKEMKRELQAQSSSGVPK